MHVGIDIEQFVRRLRLPCGGGFPLLHVLGRHLRVKIAIHGIMAQKVRHVLHVAQVIDGHDLEIVRDRRLAQGAQKATTDTAVTVDGKTQRTG